MKPGGAESGQEDTGKKSCRSRFFPGKLEGFSPVIWKAKQKSQAHKSNNDERKIGEYIAKIRDA